MPYVNINEDVWVDLDDFDTEDLIEELKRRNELTRTLRAAGERPADQILHDIYMSRIRGQDHEALLDELIYTALGKIC